MKTIAISNDPRFIVVDDEDFERLSKYTWFITNNSVVSRREYPRVNGKTTTLNITIASDVLNRREILIDHQDRNLFNNQKANLRFVTYQENAFNRVKLKGTSSKYKGVHMVTRIMKWKATITFNGIKEHLGYFKNEIDAARAYNVKAAEYFKEFANLNLV